jgi:hypothetical protein
MAYAERRESSKGARYRGVYKAADGRYKSAGTYDTQERALEVAQEAEKYAAELVRGAVGDVLRFPHQHCHPAHPSRTATQQ